jgi:hypothetical protein
MIDALGTLLYTSKYVLLYFLNPWHYINEKEKETNLMCMEQYTLKMMRIGQSRVIYSGAEVPLGVVCTDDIYTYTYNQIQLLPRDYHT